MKEEPIIELPKLITVEDPSPIQRPDQLALGICDELLEAAQLMKNLYAEGKPVEAFEQLKFVLQASNELLNGFSIIHSLQYEASTIYVEEVEDF